MILGLFPQRVKGDVVVTFAEDGMWSSNRLNGPHACHRQDAFFFSCS
jgi:hypothetical protein